MHRQIYQHFEESLRNFDKKRSPSPGMKISFQKISLTKSKENHDVKLSDKTNEDNQKSQKNLKFSNQNDLFTTSQGGIDKKSDSDLKTVKKVNFNTNTVRKSFEVKNKVVIENKIKIQDQKEPEQQKQNKYFHPKLEFLFSQQKQDQYEQPYYLDGDQKMYEPEIVELRKSFKKDAEVIQSLFSFMELFKFDLEGYLSKHFYVKQFLQILLLLRKDLNDPRRFYDIKKIILKEWQRESQNEEKISKQQLFDSLFELADIWTPEADKEQYCLFLEMLKMKIILNEEITDTKPFIDVYDITEQ